MLLKIGTQVRQSCGPVLRCGAGGQELLRLGIRPAAVVQTAAGAHQGGKVPIRRQPHFAIVQVEVPGGQGGGILLPGQGLHLDLKVEIRQGLGDMLRSGGLESVLLIHQQGHCAGPAGVQSRCLHRCGEIVIGV